MREASPQLLLTCEHAGNRIPARYREVGRRAGRILDTHRGYDPGTAELGRRLARRFGAPLVAARWSRLLIELNRSLHHPRLWSEFSRGLPKPDRDALIENIYRPHRDRVESLIREILAGGRQVVHVGLHSFTPVLEGQVRRADLGLLYDPRRPAEETFCRGWAAAILHLDDALRIRRNYPYRGNADGLTTSLRRRFSGGDYLGIELEVNQRLVNGPAAAWRALQQVLGDSLARMLPRATAGRAEAGLMKFETAD